MQELSHLSKFRVASINMVLGWYSDSKNDSDMQRFSRLVILTNYIGIKFFIFSIDTMHSHIIYRSNPTLFLMDFWRLEMIAMDIRANSSIMSIDPGRMNADFMEK